MPEGTILHRHLRKRIKYEYINCCDSRGIHFFLGRSFILVKKGKGKSVPLQEVKVPRFHDNGTGWW